MKTSSHTLIQKIADSAPALIAVYNIQTGKYIYVNDALKKIIGYPKEELLSKGLPFISSLVHPEDLKEIIAENMKALEKANKTKTENSQIETFEYRIKHKNGKWIWLRTDGVVFDRNEKGDVEYVMNISVDITKRKELLSKEHLKSEKAQEELEATKNQLDVILKNIADAVTAQDVTGKLIYANKKAAESSGYSSIEEMIKAPPLDYLQKFEMFDENNQPFSFTLLPGRRALAGEKNPEALIKTLNKQTQEVRWVIIKSTVIYKKNKTPFMVINTMQDITEQKQLEQRKDEFIGIASHELKTPLTSIKGYVQILERIIEELGNAKAKNIVSRTNVYIERLNSLITDLLDVSKIQAGKLQFNISEFDIYDLIMEGIEAVKPISEKHTIICETCIHQTVSGDKNRLDQVFMNLLSNALKYSPESDKVVIKVHRKKNDLIVSITDYGVGIPKESQEKLFNRFYRVESTASKFSGLGIGLYISNEIITRHGGRIWVESEEGKGSTFSFSLPISQK